MRETSRPPLRRTRLPYQRFHSKHNVRWLNFEHARDLHHRPHCGTLSAPLYEADIGTIQAAIERQPLLRNASFLAYLAEGIPKRTCGAFRWLNVSLRSTGLPYLQQNQCCSGDDNSPTDNSRNLDY